MELGRQTGQQALEAKSESVLSRLLQTPAQPRRPGAMISAMRRLSWAGGEGGIREKWNKQEP